MTKPDARTGYMLRHVGRALRASPLRDSVGVFVRRNGALALVLRRYLTARQSREYTDVVQRLAWDADTAWEAMTAPPG